MPNITVGLNITSTTTQVTFNAPTATVSAPATQTFTWGAASGVAIRGFSFNPGLPNNVTPVSGAGGVWTVVDANTLTSGMTASSINYWVVVSNANGTFTSADPEIINTPPSG